MSLWAFLCAWGNLPFGVAFGIAVVFAALSWSGALSVLSGGGDAEESDGDADGDEADADEGDDSDDESDDADDEGADRGVFALALAPLGKGKLPWSLLWQSFAVIFAVTGYAANVRYLREASVPLRSLLWTVPLALLVAYACVALLARLLGPVFSSEADLATSRKDLVGELGVVISTRVTAEFGEVRFRDKTGHDVRIVCALDHGSRVPREGEQVVVVGLDPRSGRVLVAPLEDDPDEPVTPPVTRREGTKKSA
jgi:membrane protein implicated in regulation of membrane protease activity